MNRLDNVIADVGYILDCLMVLRNIEQTGCCNDCANYKNCPIAPVPGQMVRYNCYSYDPIEKE